MINDGRVNAHEQHAEPHGGNRAYWNRVMLVEDGAQCTETKRDRGADGRAALDPQLVEHLPKAVQAAPDDKVPASAMPPTADNLRCHGVHVRGDGLAGIRLEVGDNADVEEEHAECNSDPHASRKENGDKAQESHPEERADGGIAVTAKRNVQVVTPPARKRDVPTTPEFRGALCLVRAVEVLRQAESHEEGDTDGDVRIAREVGIDLQRIGEKRNQVFYAREEERRIENAIDKVCREVVAQDNLLGKSVQNPEHGHAECSAGKEIRLVKLRHKLVCTHDRACDKLREERKVKAEIQNVIDSLDFTAVNVDAVAHRLEREERNAHREDNLIDERVCSEHGIACRREEVIDVKFDPSKVVKGVQEEVRILIVAEHQQVDDDDDYHQHLLFPLDLRFLDPLADEEVRYHAEDEDAHVASARFVIEEQAGSKEERVTEQ